MSTNHLKSVRRELAKGLPSTFQCSRKHRRATSSGRTALVALLLLATVPALADSSLPPAYWAYRQLPDAKQEARAQALMAELRCLVCQGQSIADSDAELAADMRDLVRRRVAQGEQPAQIRSWLIGRYGSWISYRPTAEPATWPPHSCVVTPKMKQETTK